MKTKILSGALALLFTVSFSSAFADQPHMEAALGHLRAARAELEKANTDKAGNRREAIALVDKVIVATQRGVEAARLEPRPAR
ncbi:MAG: hypothetical protein H0X73_05805 [Chthoniobacterales bacterium]|nr:hypothetical protein [Chthoniobacterales bacterium]